LALVARYYSIALDERSDKSYAAARTSGCTYIKLLRFLMKTDEFYSIGCAAKVKFIGGMFSTASANPYP
jgi:hypothetical protein